MIMVLVDDYSRLSLDTRQKIELRLTELNRLETLRLHGKCFSCRSVNVQQYGTEIICTDCGYTREDYSADCD